MGGAGAGFIGTVGAIDRACRSNFMILATSNQARQLLCVNYIGRVRPAELKQGREELKVLLADLRPGFCFLANLSNLEVMGPDCRTELGRNMDLVSQHGVGRVVRVIPDPFEDRG